MCMYCKAASTVLDTLWSETNLREHFHQIGADLSTLGPLTHEVFAPTYRMVKDQLDPRALTMLEAQLTEDLLAPFWDRPGFRQIWDEWDQTARDEFVSEQSEVNLAKLLLKFYAEEFTEAYKTAYKNYTEDGVARAL